MVVVNKMKTPFPIIIYLGIFFGGYLTRFVDIRYLYLPMFTLSILGGFIYGKYGPEA